MSFHDGFTQDGFTQGDAPFKRVDPLTTTGPVFGRKREQLIRECDELEGELRRLGTQLNALAERHRAVRDLLAAKRRVLHPNLARRRGRQPAPDASVQLPPIRFDAVKLWGRRLRSMCLKLLRRNRGPLALPDLHALLHRHGFEVDAVHPVKALADAMAYEVEQGRAKRRARGIYELVEGAPPRPGRHGNPALPTLPA